MPTLNSGPQAPQSRIKIVAVVEATTINAVAKNVLEFYRAANELRQRSADRPIIELSLVTFVREALARPSGPTKINSGKGAIDGSDTEFVRAARQLGLEIDVIPERRRFDRSVISTLRKIITQRSPDIVVTHQVKSHFLMRLSRLWQKYPWVAFNHGYTTTDRKMLFYNQLDRWSLPKADRVITVCDAFTQRLVKIGVQRERIHVQHNSVRPAPRANAEDVQALKGKLGITNEERIVLTAGRLSREKAHIDLLQAFKFLLELGPELKPTLVIAGDGPERAKLESASASLGIADRVVFAGQLSNVQLYYAAADVLANPSHSEGSPYVLLEAMVAGLPIVATGVGGVQEMLKDKESALVVPPQNPRLFAAALHRLLTSRELAERLRANARAHAELHFSPESHAQSLIKIYQELLPARVELAEAQLVSI